MADDYYVLGLIEHTSLLFILNMSALLLIIKQCGVQDVLNYFGIHAPSVLPVSSLN